MGVRLTDDNQHGTRDALANGGRHHPTNSTRTARLDVFRSKFFIRTFFEMLGRKDSLWTISVLLLKRK